MVQMAMVSNKFLGALAIKLELHKHLIYFSNPLMSQNNRYAEDIKAAVLESKSSVDYWTSITDPPKVDCLLHSNGRSLTPKNSAYQIWWRHTWVPYSSIQILISRWLKNFTTDMCNRPSMT